MFINMFINRDAYRPMTIKMFYTLIIADECGNIAQNFFPAIYEYSSYMYIICKFSTIHQSNAC